VPPHETSVAVAGRLLILIMPNILHAFNSSAHPNANSYDLGLGSPKAAPRHKIYF